MCILHRKFVVGQCTQEEYILMFLNNLLVSVPTLKKKCNDNPTIVFRVPYVTDSCFLAYSFLIFLFKIHCEIPVWKLF